MRPLGAPYTELQPLIRSKMNHQDEHRSLRLDLLLNSIEEECDPPKYLRLRDAFVIDCMTMIGHRLPPVASRALQVANDFRTGLASLASVRDAHQACWEELRIGHKEMHLDDPEVSAIRAAVCILHGQLHPESDDFVDSVSFCLRLLNNVEPHLAQQESLLHKYFRDCLEQ